jgi:hypothetical protein
MVSDTVHEFDEAQSRLRRVHRLLVGGLVAAFFISIGVFVVFVVQETRPNTLLFEGAKALPQIGLVLAVGATLSLLTSEYQQARQHQEKERDENRRQEEYRQELLKTTLTQATASYTEVKRARRLMGALALTMTSDQRPAILMTEYNKQMAVISDAQLQFENLVDDVETSAAGFASAHDLKRHLRSVETHLGKLISEYEKARQSTGERPQLPLAGLPCLDTFLAQFADDNEKFKAGFQPLKLGFVKVQELIRRDLLGR